MRIPAYETCQEHSPQRVRDRLVESRTIVSRLWDVYDGTGPKLMRRFFDALASGQAAPDALAQSQRGFLRDLRASDEPEPWLQPYFWAVYTVTGDDHTESSLGLGRPK